MYAKPFSAHAITIHIEGGEIGRGKATLERLLSVSRAISLHDAFAWLAGSAQRVVSESLVGKRRSGELRLVADRGCPGPGDIP